MTMRKLKLAILAIAVLLHAHICAGYLFAQNSRIALGPQDAKTEPVTRQETLRGSITPEANGGTYCITTGKWRSYRNEKVGLDQPPATAARF
jgi:hypothetical protein